MVSEFEVLGRWHHPLSWHRLYPLLNFNSSSYLQASRTWQTCQLRLWRTTGPLSLSFFLSLSLWCIHSDQRSQTHPESLRQVGGGQPTQLDPLKGTKWSRQSQTTGGGSCTFRWLATSTSCSSDRSQAVQWSHHGSSSWLQSLWAAYSHALVAKTWMHAVCMD